MTFQPWMLESLGRRVVLTKKVGEYPAGRTGRLVSLQAGAAPLENGPYMTVCFSLFDESDEENVPLDAVRPMLLQG